MARRADGARRRDATRRRSPAAASPSAKGGSWSGVRFGERVAAGAAGYFLRSSTSTCLATAFSVSNTPTPVVATASKVGSRL